MKIADLLSNKKPVMLYVSGEARHFTAGHNSEPVTIADVSEYGVLVEGAGFYPWAQVLAIAPYVEDAADEDYVFVNPGARMPTDPHHYEKHQSVHLPDPRQAVFDKEKREQLQ